MQSSCAHHVPHYTVQALRARGKRAVALPHAFGLPAIVAGRTSSATSTALAVSASTATKTLHNQTHRRLRQALRRQRRTARPLFTRPACPQRALRSHDHQRAPRKLSVPPTTLSRIHVQRIDFSVRPLSVRPSGKWLVGPNSASSTIASFFIRLGNNRCCFGVYCAATDESGQRRARCKALIGNRTLQLFRDTRPYLSFLRAASIEAIVGALLSFARC